jgi:hypothetical protein
LEEKKYTCNEAVPSGPAKTFMEKLKGFFDV